MKIFKNFIFVFYLCLSFGYTQEYLVTNVIKISDGSNQRVRVMLNSFLVIENIKYLPNGVLEFPSYVSEQQEIYPQIGVLDQSLEKTIITSIQKDLYRGYCPLEKPKFKIEKIYKLNAKKRKANVNLIIDSKIMIVCGVMSGKKGLWVVWPSSKKFDGKYHKDVYILDKNLQNEIEKEILEKYKI